MTVYLLLQILRGNKYKPKGEAAAFHLEATQRPAQGNASRWVGGFTLIELLVVIIIIGILSAIALPSFLGQTNKARESEAKQTIATITRGQQAYYLENGEFIIDNSKWKKLGLGLKKQTRNYSYSIWAINNDDFVGAGITASSKLSRLHSYTGAVGVSSGDLPEFTNTLCKAIAVGPQDLGQPNLDLTKDQISCGNGVVGVK